MNPASSAALLRTDAAALGAVARHLGGAPAPLVPSCPDWTITDLIFHLGAIHRRIGKLIRQRERTPIVFGREEDLTFMDLPAPPLAWFVTGHAPRPAPIPAALVTWFAQGADRLADALAAIAPDEPIWTYAPPQRAWFWQRMMPLETALHRWDAQNAVGQTAPIDATLARDGLDLRFDIVLPLYERQGTARHGSGETYCIRQTDGSGVWLVRFDPTGATVAHEAAPATVAIEGPASALLLFLAQRITADELTVSGDATFVGRYFELFPHP